MAKLQIVFSRSAMPASAVERFVLSRAGKEASGPVWLGWREQGSSCRFLGWRCRVRRCCSMRDMPVIMSLGVSMMQPCWIWLDNLQPHTSPHAEHRCQAGPTVAPNNSVQHSPDACWSLYAQHAFWQLNGSLVVPRFCFRGHAPDFVCRQYASLCCWCQVWSASSRSALLKDFNSLA